MNGVPITESWRHISRPRWWLHILLLLATLVTTSVMGAGFVESFRHNRPVDIVAALNGYSNLIRNPAVIVEGLPFSLPLIVILLSHELGHYLTCVYTGDLSTDCRHV